MGAAAASAFGTVVSAIGQNRANIQNRREAQRNRDFQARMSGTAIERRMADLRRSGLNPILAGKFDASTPAGNMATMGNVGASAMQGMQAGSQSAKNVNQSKVIKAQVLNVAADTALKQAQANKEQSADALLQNQANLVHAQLPTARTAQETAVETRDKTKFEKEITQARIAGVKTEEAFYAWINSADAAEIAKASGKAGPLLLQAIRAYLAVNRKGKR